VRGSKPGTQFLRRARPGEQKLVKVGESEFEATRAALRPASTLGRTWASLRKTLIGEPLATASLPHQRLSKIKALAVYSSDNLSSSAYATEEILIVLVGAGTAALTRSIPVTAALVLLTLIVVFSYRQTIRAYPSGGGAYIVATDNLGFNLGLFAGSALLVDYIMTVSVSIAAGVAAITSAFPGLHDARVLIALASVALITIANLRGIKESGTIFAIPTYFFVITFGGMLAWGLIRVALGADLRAGEPANAIEPGVAVLTPFLLLRAFSSGAAALTGIEAVANGVPNFKPPEWRNAITTQAWMVTILSVFFIGTTILAHQLHIVPSETETVVSQIAKTVFGKNLLFYAVQAGTALILLLAANTAFADLPVLSSVMARDSVMPKQFLFRGDRLAFSNGIIVLGLASSLILILFQADTTRIIPLYAFGVFMAFTLSQFGMVVHWRRHHEPGWRRSQIINGTGGCVTLVVAMIVGATKFTHGAWLSMAIMIGLVVVLWRIHEHYTRASRDLGENVDPHELLEDFSPTLTSARTTVIAPVNDLNRATLRTIAYARSISRQAEAVHVALNREEARQLRLRWEESVPDVPLVIVESPFGSLLEPLLAYVDVLQQAQPDRLVTVVLPQFVAKRPWSRLLHNQLGRRLENALLARPNTVIVHVPFHLAEDGATRVPRPVSTAGRS
jgi:amino acid transporter